MDSKFLPKVLYIEDDEPGRSLVRRLLEQEYLLLEASDPLSGIDLAKDTLPDLILLDINLPKMTGYEAATRLKAILPDTPLVAVTASQPENIRARALAAGFAGFIPKPIDVETFAQQVGEYLQGKREELPNAEVHLREYQGVLVEHLEARVRELTSMVTRNSHLQRANQEMINMLIRSQSMLEAGARVSHGITSILKLNDLLNTTVDIICDEFHLYYSGIFLISEDKQFADLQAGHGEPGAAMIAEHFRLPVDRRSMIGVAILDKTAGISLDVEGEPSHFKNPFLPNTRSEVALPLIFKDNVLGALSVQSAELNAFNKEDTTALQSLADQIAIAIHNAQLLRQLENANEELVRSKTFEAIATATGEAIHWVGNKAAPVPGSVKRLRGDLLNLIAAFRTLIPAAQAPAKNSPLQGVAENIFEEAAAQEIDLSALAKELSQMPEKRRNALLSLESMLEDFQIIENSANTILTIKEDLIGPARQRKPSPIALTEILPQIVENMGLPKGVVSLTLPADLPLILGDPRQVDQVFNNLIKNAWEALDGNPAPSITVRARTDSDPRYVLVGIQDNGPGIPPEVQEKIWVSFFTTKGGRGGTGLGLSACMEIIRQNGGKIWVESQAEKGATFFVLLPATSSQTEET
jgi:signal transduction histidine kinase/DNA-binding NarL/FixJ family response regulator